VASEYLRNYLSTPAYPEATIRPADLRLEPDDLTGTFGEAEIESAVIAVLTPSRDAGQWLSPSWLAIAEQLEWTKSYEDGRLDGRFGRLPAVGELGVTAQRVPYGLTLVHSGLETLRRQGLIQVRTLIVGVKLDFLVPQTALIERLLQRQSTRA